MSDPYDWVEHSLAVIQRANWTRSVKPITITQADGAEMILDGKPVINFASNDYLGLATHPALKAAAIAAIETYGTGATGSRLLSGQRPCHQSLEQAIADWKQTEAALVFSSGYLANLSTIQAVAGPRDIILADQYNHSSLKNGAKLSGATVLEYAHRNESDLHSKLSSARPHYRRCLIVTDGVFSMDGDLCPLPKVLALAEQFAAMVLVDDAHATGVLGKTGAGSVEHMGEHMGQVGAACIQIGTLSKALGSLGGYVAGHQSLIQFLRNRGAGWIYTTGLSPGDCGAAAKAIALCRNEPKHRQDLWNNIAHLKATLPEIIQASALPMTVLPSDAAIICLEMDSPQSVLRLSQSLLEQGCFVPAIRPPTVPTSRLRISLMATHQPRHINQLIHAFKRSL